MLDGGVGAALLDICRASGLGALWVGWAPSVQRSLIMNAAELATYDSAKVSHE